MTSYKKLLIASSLMILAGCNSGSGSDSKTTMIKKALKPAADYQFNNDEITEIYKNREKVLNSVSFYYDGKVYNHVLFGEELDDNVTVVRLMDDYSDTIDLMINRNEEAKCIVYSDNKYSDNFDCGKEVQSISNETTVINSTSVNERTPVLLEYSNDEFEYLSHIGSTALTAIDEYDQVDIKTSAVFKDFLRDIFGQDVSEHDQNSSRLGISTFIQLGNIVQAYTGREMLLMFDNVINGSADDDVNMYTGLMIRNHEIATMITKNGSVFSGGTDLFTAGIERTLERKAPTDAIELNKQVGVHSWSDGEKTAKKIPFTDLSHRKQATYFKIMLGDKGVDFYMYTLDSAPASGEHWVTKKESDKYNLIQNITD
ncbi:MULTISPECIES: alpha/beta hydrolase [unclassified Photobacterium]|uniref:alpha/beta hydrolase n=1 Tax=unclassified Photobacterium TaxID=2628852 RepID=UPI001EDDFEA0|nr:MULTISPECIES: alpha/beta hydrolase [unclassified Photobacterium]MCG3864530.1 alpha/beta hydrolase [Photobacterium sp. Ph6]MCG3876062.1 alpha/beta hydrolase [Photobacterium sp. Ph5]